MKHEDGDGGTGWEWVQGESLEALARDLEFVLVPWRAESQEVDRIVYFKDFLQLLGRE